MRIAVAMSGGVNSSLVAILMKKVGYDIIGVTSKLNIEVIRTCRTCNSTDKYLSYFPESMMAAKRIAKEYHFSHYIISSDNFQRELSEYEYPEFGSSRDNLLIVKYNELMMKSILGYAKTAGCQRIATGHYARNYRCKNGRYCAARGFETELDQSYLLSTFTQDLLEFLMFPLGEYYKDAILRLAKDNNLNVSDIFKNKSNCFPCDEDLKNNRLYNGLFVVNINYMCEASLDGIEAFVKINGSQLFKAALKEKDAGIYVYFDKPVSNINPGDAVVFYNASGHIYAGALIKEVF